MLGAGGNLDGCSRCIKYTMAIFNILFFISGATLVGGGIFLHHREGPFATLLPSFPFLNAANLCIAVGVIIMGVSFLGCFGALRENPCLLITYFIILCGIFVMEIAIAALGFTYRNQVSYYVAQDLTTGGLQKYNSTGEGGLTQAWDTMQSYLFCCGVDSYQDWGYFSTLYQANETPDSCCFISYPGCGKDPIENKYQGGCVPALEQELQQNINVLGAIGVGVAFFQIMGMAFAWSLFQDLRRQPDTYQPYP